MTGRHGQPLDQPRPVPVAVPRRAPSPVPRVAPRVHQPRRLRRSAVWCVALVQLVLALGLGQPLLLAVPVALVFLAWRLSRA